VVILQVQVAGLDNPTLPKIIAVAANWPAYARLSTVASAGQSAASYTTTGDTTIWELKCTFGSTATGPSTNRLVTLTLRPNRFLKESGRQTARHFLALRRHMRFPCTKRGLMRLQPVPRGTRRGVLHPSHSPQDIYRKEVLT